MAISREEVEQIAEEVAKRVVTPQLVCSCGYNALSTARSGESLRADIDAKNKKVAIAGLEYFNRDISDAEVACHLKLDDARRLVGEINSAIEAEDWPEATIKAVEAENSIEEALHEASTKQGG